MGKIGDLIVDKGASLIGELILQYFINLVKNGLPSRVYNIKKGYLGGNEKRPYFSLEADEKIGLDINDFGHPTTIMIFTTDKTIIRHLFMGRYAGQNQVNVNEFMRWFLDLLEHYRYPSTSDIEIQRSYEKFERTYVAVEGPPCKVVREELNMAKWFVRITRDSSTN